MAIPKTKDKVEAFVKSANSDVIEKKAKREPKPDDMPLLVFRVHRDVNYTIKKKAENDRRTFSELCREIFMAGMEARGIVIETKPADSKD